MWAMTPRAQPAGAMPARLTLSSGRLCRAAFGSTAEFDGVRSCRCKVGHVPLNGTCVRGSDAVCRASPLGTHSTAMSVLNVH